MGGFLECVAYDKRFDAGKFPVLSFDYKLGKDVDVDIGCTVNGLQKYI